MVIKKDIRQLSLEEITTQLQSVGEAPFRAAQVYSWLWEKSGKVI
jgi:23S rRNA (adenine2503-C2)-methyltransferase